jgi:putative endonuclease
MHLGWQAGGNMDTLICMTFAYTYVLKCADGDMYIGSTDDLERRVREHTNGGCSNTCKRLPVRLIYYEACRSLDAARAREKQLKTGYGRGFLRKRLAFEFETG